MQVIPLRYIEVGMRFTNQADLVNRVEEGWSNEKRFCLVDQAFIHQHQTSCPDWRGCTCSPTGLPLVLVVDRHSICHSGDIGQLAHAIGVVIAHIRDLLPFGTLKHLAEATATAPL